MRRTRPAEPEQSDPAIEMQFSLPDVWPRRLFLALCRRYGLKPYRTARQLATTVMLRVAKKFVDQVLLPEFGEQNTELSRYPREVKTRLIREKVLRDTNEASDAGKQIN